jgi:hypothetical protein
MSKKFTIPKKFKNVGISSPLNERVTFMRVYHDSAANLARVTNPWVKSYLMNEELYLQTAFSFSYMPTILAPNKFIWGNSYAKAAKAEDIRIYVDYTNQLGSKKASFNVPHVCTDSIFATSGGNWDHL